MAKKRGKSKRSIAQSHATDTRDALGANASNDADWLRAEVRHITSNVNDFANALVFVHELQREFEISLVLEETEELKPGDELIISFQDLLQHLALARSAETLASSPSYRLSKPVSFKRVRMGNDFVEDAVFRKFVTHETLGLAGIFHTDRSDRELVVPLSARHSEGLHTGDACEVLFKESRKEPRKGHVPLSKDTQAVFLHRKLPQSTLDALQKAESYEDFQSIISHYYLPDSEQHWPPDPTIVPTPDEILTDIAAVQLPIIRKLNQWLSSLEGRTFASDHASLFVAQVRHVVARAGCELIFDNRPVTLVAMTSGRKTASLHLKTLRSSPVETIHSSQSLPALHVQPIAE